VELQLYTAVVVVSGVVWWWSGNHLIEVISDGELVAGGSFTSKAYNTAAIAVSPVNVGVVGMPVEFSSS